MRNPRIVVLDEDEALGQQVERVTTDLRPRTEALRCDSFEAVDALVEATGPFDILIAGPLVAQEGGLQQLRRLRAQLPDMKLILAFDQWPRRGLRDTIRTGAIDILRLPVADHVLVDAIEQTLEIAQAAPPQLVEPLRPSEGGTAIAVVSATGGCGKTFFATNLAYHLGSQRQTRTCLLDFDLQFGEVSAALRIKPRRTISDLVAIDADGDELGRHLEEHLEVHESGIRVLAAPDEPAAADLVDTADIARVIEAARSGFDYVIIDAPAGLREPVLAAIENADRLFALATLDLPSIRNLGVMMTTFRQLKVPADRVSLLLNKVEPDVGIDVARVEKYFPQGFSMVIPYGREVNRALNMGCPVMAYAPRGEVSRALASGMGTMPLGGADGAAGAGVEQPRGRRRRFSRTERKGA